MKHTKKDLNEWMEMCSSIKKIIKHPRGETIVWHPRAMLSDNGSLISLPLFLKRNGERNMVQPIDFSKSYGEKEQVRLVKSQYKASMRSFFGPMWKKCSRALNAHNIPEQKDVRKQLQGEIKAYYHEKV